MTMAATVDAFSSMSIVQPDPSTHVPGGSVFDLLGVAAMAASVTLAALQDRVRYAPACEPRKERLLEHALRRLNPEMSGVYIPSNQAEQAKLILNELIADAQPTPQVAVDEDGAIEALWLVNGTEVLLSVEPDGSGVLGAYDPENAIFEYEFDDLTDPLDRGKIAVARHLLNELGEAVTYRVLV